MVIQCYQDLNLYCWYWDSYSAAMHWIIILECWFLNSGSLECRFILKSGLTSFPIFWGRISLRSKSIVGVIFIIELHNTLFYLNLRPPKTESLSKWEWNFSNWTDSWNYFFENRKHFIKINFLLLYINMLTYKYELC